ncbi:MAG: DedA family protein [Candidatus Rokuibacteriota bacterium]
MSTETLLSLFITYGYSIIFVAIVLDNAGLPIPGELLLVVLGGVAQHGQLDLLVGLAVATTAAMTGDNLGYWAGRLGCEHFLRSFAGRTSLRPWRTSVVFGRFVIGARVLLAPFAGCSRMPFGRFLVLDALGCLLWTGSFILLGYVAGGRLGPAQDWGRVATGLVGLAFAVAGTWYLAGRLARRWRASRG